MEISAECSSGRRRSLKIETERLMTYLSDHIIEEDCTVLEGINECSYKFITLIWHYEDDVVMI